MAHKKHYYISNGKKKEFSFYEKWAGTMRIVSEKKMVDIVDSGIGLSYRPARPAYIAWRTGTTTLCLSWLYPVVGNFEFGCWKHQSRDDLCKPNIFRICFFSDINSYWHTYKQIVGTNMVVSFIKLHRSYLPCVGALTMYILNWLSSGYQGTKGNWRKIEPFLGCTFTKIKLTFMKSVWKDEYFDTPFAIFEGTMKFFWEGQ